MAKESFNPCPDFGSSQWTASRCEYLEHSPLDFAIAKLAHHRLWDDWSLTGSLSRRTMRKGV